MGEEEEYLGGFTSANLKKGLIKGYGIYATNKRIIGIKSRKGVLAGALVGGIIGGALGGVVAGKLGEKLTKDESAKIIEELDRKKDLEITKEQVSQMEVKKPGFFRGGYLKIRLASGEEVKVVIYGKKEFERTRDLMQAFYPEKLRAI